MCQPDDCGTHLSASALQRSVWCLLLLGFGRIGLAVVTAGVVLALWAGPYKTRELPILRLRSCVEGDHEPCSGAADVGIGCLWLCPDDKAVQHATAPGLRRI
jgi:hypothetical protein